MFGLLSHEESRKMEKNNQAQAENVEEEWNSERPGVAYV